MKISLLRSITRLLFKVVLLTLFASAFIGNAVAGMPTAANNLNAERTSDSTVYLSWQVATDDRGIGFYRVYRSDVIKGLRHISTVVNPRLADIQLGAGIEYT